MSKLFQEVKLGSLTIKNRLGMAPMGFIHDAEGGIDEDEKAYLVERAKGGFGIIYPSAHTVLNKYELPMFSGNYLVSYGQAMQLEAAVQEVHRFGAKFALQLTPGYGRVNVGTPDCTTHVSASDNTVFYYPDVKCHALTVEEIGEIVQAMGTAAWYAKEAGVDVIEIHAYGGYLIDQFMSKIWNRREDEYGGSLENRMRFFYECYGAVRAVVGEDFPISVKYTPVHTIEGGRTFEDEGIEIAHILDNMGLAYIHLDEGCYERWNKAIPSGYDPSGSQAYIAKRLRAEGIKTPFAIQGKLNDPEMAEELLESGTADLILLGKQSLADPFYPKKLQSGHIEDIDFCCGCCECLNGGGLGSHGQGCAINPRTGVEVKFPIRKAETPRKVLVVGGGPGGMYAAKLAAMMGHTVELWEKSGKLGGDLKAAGAPSFKSDMNRYYTNLATQVYKLGVNVRLMKTADRASVDKFSPDVVINATGADPVKPRIAGIDGANVIEAIRLLEGKETTGNKVVVLGGGLVGCEAAVDLDMKGKDVTIIEMMDDILLTANMAANEKKGLMDRINDSSVTICTGTRLEEIRDGEVTVSDANGSRTIECDNIVYAVGFKSRKQLAEELKGADYPVFSVGNSNSPRKVWDAVHESFHIVRQLDDLI